MGGGKGVTESEKEDSTAAAPPPPPPPAEVKKKRRSIISYIWNGIFRLKRDDIAKRLEYISKEEASVIVRMKRRSQTWRWLARQLIIFTVIFEVIAVGYAIMTTRSGDLNWKMRAFQVMPMFLLPGLSWLAYSGFGSFARMCDRKDQKTLERLRAERQAKIDELKEKTNYYTTQQLIQRYDPDPAAKAAAATVLASKLGLDSGLKVYVGDESKLSVPTAKSSDVEIVQSSGLRNRKKLNTTRSSSVESTPNSRSGEATPESSGNEGLQMSEHNQLVVNHYPQGSSTLDRGWIAQIAALLVGEDPAQSYALICGNCHMHNGLARKEDFPHITYYCPHCHALNKPKQSEERESVSGSLSNSHNTSSLTSGGNGDPVNNASSDLINDTSSPKSDSSHPSNSLVKEEDSSVEEVGKVTSLDSAVN